MVSSYEFLYFVKHIKTDEQNSILFRRVFILFISVALTQGTISTEWELVQKDTRSVATDGMLSMLEIEV